MPWSRHFEDPIPLPGGRELVTLQDAGEYILRLSDRESKAGHWMTAGELLIMAAEDRGPLMHARIAMLKALNRGRPAPEHGPPRKRAKAYTIIRS